MSATALLADPEKQGNSWCDACQQSITNARVPAHLVSKKHTDAAQKLSSESKSAAVKETKSAAAKETKPKKAAAKTSPTPSPPSDNAAPKTKKAVKAVKAADSDVGLPRDPKDPGRYWCGICKTSLDATRAANHLDTDKHRRAEDKFLGAAMKELAV